MFARQGRSLFAPKRPGHDMYGLTKIGASAMANMNITGAVGRRHRTLVIGTVPGIGIMGKREIAGDKVTGIAKKRSFPRCLE